MLDVFRMGTSFSALILASKSSHARPEFWKRILSPEGWGREQAEDGDRRAPHRPSQATPPATERPTPSPTGHEGKLRPRAGPGLVAPASSLCACNGEGWEECGAGHLGACACRCPARSWLTGACLYPCPGPRLGVHQAGVAPWPLPRGGWDCGTTHFIFSARCSVFSRMAWDSWDTGFSMRLSKITCGDPGVSTAPTPLGAPPLHAPRGSLGVGRLPPRGSGAESCWPGCPHSGRSCSGPGPEGPGSRAAPSGS